MDPVVRVHNFSKRYTLGRAPRHDTLRDLIAERTRGIRQLFGGRRGPANDDDSPNYLWALKDVSFEVQRGEVLGIIGGNGAGKSTLLKLLSRITKPTTGRAEVYGRVASLLEVGTGFHPELTGRENIFLNGAILGMKRVDIQRRFDEIVAFAEVEKFIHTPVKRYSSGMYVRLAFAVAAHLDPDVLIVDEVLAVGDAKFQEKCLGAMRNTASSGRTVIFVSHNMVTVQHLCKRVMMLKAGRIHANGAPHEVIRSYLSGDSAAPESPSVELAEGVDRIGNGHARIVRLDITNGRGRPTSTVSLGDSVSFAITAKFRQRIHDPAFGIALHTVEGEPLLDLRSGHAGLRMGAVDGQVTVEVTLDNLGLHPGQYLVSPWIADYSAGGADVDLVMFCCKLRVDPAPGPFGDLQLDPAWGRYWVPSRWRVCEPHLASAASTGQKAH